MINLILFCQIKILNTSCMNHENVLCIVFFFVLSKQSTVTVKSMSKWTENLLSVTRCTTTTTAIALHPGMYGCRPSTEGYSEPYHQI